MNSQILCLSVISSAIMCAAEAAVASQCGSTEYGWTASAGAEDYDAANTVGVGLDGTLFVGGGFQGSVDFDPTKRKDIKRSRGGVDFFVSRFEPSGAYLSTFRVGNRSHDTVWQIAIAPDSSFGICGIFREKVDFDPGRDKDKHNADPEGDVFVSSYAPDGDYRWTRTLGGRGADAARAVAIDRDGKIVIVGHFRYTVDFDPGPGKDRRKAVGGDDVFVVKLDSEGRYLWARTFGSGGLGDEDAFGVATDGQNNILVTGYFYGSVDFDPGPGVDMHHSNGQEDAFITKLASDGSYQWTHTFGGTDLRDWGTDVTVDDADNVYVTGHFRGTVDFDRRGRGDVRVARSFGDIFVTSRAPDGAYRWTAHMPGTFIAGGLAISLDRNLSQVVVVGPFSGTVDFDPGEGVDERTAISEPRDIFATWLRLDGSYVRTETFGGTGNDVARTVAVGPDSSVVVAGHFDSSDADFDPTSGVDTHASNGNDDIFITKLYCGPCEAVERHSLTVKTKNRTLLAEVRALVPGGRVTIECAPTDPPGEPIQTRVDIDGDNMGKYKLKKLKKGEYACAITEVRDANGNVVCDEPAGKRVVNVK